MPGNFYKVPTVSVSSKETLHLYTGWGVVDPATRMAALAMLVSKFHTDRIHGLEAVEAALACFCCAVPEMAPELQKCTSLTIAADVVTTANATAFTEGERPGSGPLHRLMTTSPPNGDAAEVDSEDGLYAAVSSILISLGKQAGEGPDAAVVKSRPDALIRRFHISDEAQKCLPGRVYGPTLKAMGNLFEAFSTYTEVRMHVTLFFIGLQQSIGHAPRHVEIMLNNFRLLRGTQLSHLGAIIKFMNMHPWSVRVPELMPYYMALSRELASYATIPTEAREYHRMLCPQSEFLFVSADYKPLIAVAGDFVKDVEATFGNYTYRAADYLALITKVREYAPNQVSYIGAGTLAAALGIQDAVLPSRDSTQQQVTQTPV